MSGVGITSYGTYVPQFRLERTGIGEALRSGGGKGTRSVAGHDEDAMTMGVAAARRALAAGAGPDALGSVWFATTAPPYDDKTNATAIHAAIAAPPTAGAFDVNGAVRSGVGALRAALGQRDPALVVLSDVRTGMPGSADERDGGDAAAALVIGTGDLLCELVGSASRSIEVLDRWREPTSTSARTWEDRFGEQALVPVAVEALDDALGDAGLSLAEVDHLVVAGSNDRAARGLAKRLGAKARSVVDDRSATVGNPGAAQIGLLVADALDAAAAGDVVAVLAVGDGADAFVLRATEALEPWRAARPTRTDPTLDVSYPTFLIWRGQLHREPPRRPDPEIPMAPAAYRGREWKFSFLGSRCTECGTVHLPPQRICGSCGAVDLMEPTPVADALGTIVTVTADHLAFSEDPPIAAAVIDFDGGGRVQAELTDHGGVLPEIGDRVEMALRRAYTVNGIHNYVWKARPVREAQHG
jgi:hydroxymethylglutaryl-CoA synthase